MQNIHDRIKAVRLSNDLSQTQFGNAIGLTKNSVMKLEQEGTTVTPRNIKAICSIFAINEQWLIDGIGEMKDRRSIDDRFLELYRNLEPPFITLLDQFILSLVECQNACKKVESETSFTI